MTTRLTDFLHAAAMVSNGPSLTLSLTSATGKRPVLKAKVRVLAGYLRTARQSSPALFEGDR